jgi:peroxisomal membrane protein 2
MGLLGAPWSHYYFQFLDECLPPTPEPFTKTTLLKVFIDQFIQAPLLLLVMICSLSLMKFEGPQVVEKDLVESFWPGLIANWKLWITASLVNLAFVKPELRVLYTNMIFFVWVIILSIILNTPQ